MNRLTQKSREALQEAQTAAVGTGHTEVDGDHLLLALLEQEDGLIPRLPQQAGTEPKELRAAVREDLSRHPKVTGPGAAPGQVEAALSKDIDTAGETRLQELRRELADLRGEADAKQAYDLNRVDDIVLFKPLGERQIERIVELRFEELRQRLAERRATVELTDAGREVITHQGYDPVDGARPLRRCISHEVETLVGRALPRGDVQDGATVRVDAEHGELVVTYDQPEDVKEGRAA
ncbi:Clp protease N-terminal domain-containing protein [Streptomyces sp. NPDC006333]|uniref:Clp protease N-terminal domain-containing protein n=1 Tax=Streptomyces sp. NPDC006333 TaxID=3156753 RepID=UPI0033B44665